MSTPVRIRASVLALVMLLAASGARAMVATAPVTFAFTNGTAMNYAFLFIDNPAYLQLEGVQFGAGLSDWVIAHDGGGYTVIEGPVAAAGGTAQWLLEYAAPPVGVQWAEVLFDGVAPAVNRYGTAVFDAGLGWSLHPQLTAANRNTIVEYFAAVPGSVPLPGSLLLLWSGLALLACRQGGSRHSPLPRPA